MELLTTCQKRPDQPEIQAPGIALKPCPFCGDDRPQLEWDGVEDFYVFRSVACSCGGRGPSCCDADDELPGQHAAEEWNERYEPPAG